MNLYLPNETSHGTNMKSEEWFDLLDLQGTVIGRAPRSICHGNPGLIHRAVHVLIFDHHGRLFLQKRSAHKDVQPNKWDTSVGGHLNPGEIPVQGAAREMREELGIEDRPLVPAYEYVWQSEIETELISTFAVSYDGPFNLDPVEIAEGRFWSFREIQELLGTGAFTPQFEKEFPRMVEWYNSNTKGRSQSPGAHHV